VKNLVTISAPSGAGKTTLCRALQEKTEMKFSVSCTTRDKRDYEVEGEDYHFISEEEFKTRLENNEFVETEDVHGCMYGTLRKTIENAIADGEIVLFEVDVKGAMTIKSIYPEQTISIFVLPPSLADLRERLIKRGTDSDSRIKKRLERLDIEVSYKERFDFNVINDDVQRATDEIIDIIHTQNKGVPHVS